MFPTIQELEDMKTLDTITVETEWWQVKRDNGRERLLLERFTHILRVERKVAGGWRHLGDYKFGEEGWKRISEAR
jgi:hypothetical protein